MSQHLVLVRRAARPAALLLRLAALSVGVAGAWASTAGAQAVCVPDAIGVPGQPGPPDWSTPAATPQVEGHNDPRWNGAFGVGHNGGEAQVRALRKDVGGQRFLYLGLHAKTDPQGSTLTGAAGDRVVLGLGKADGTLAYRITLRLDTSAATNTGAISFDGSATPPWNGKIAVDGFEEWKAGAWHPLTISSPPRPILPTWLRDWTRLFVYCPTGNCVTGGSKFNVQLRVPIGGAPVDTSGTITDAMFDGGLEPNGDLVTFHRLDAHFVDTSGPIPTDQVTRYVWPEVVVGPGLLDYTPPVSAWKPVVAGSATPCAGTIGFEGHHQVATANTPPTAITPTTEFHARPRNSSGAPVNPSHLKVQFRIADWGSTLFSSPQWNNVCESNPATTSTTPVASGLELDLSCSNAVPFDLCDYTDTGACAGPPPPTHSSHQCILAQLSTASGAPQLVLGTEAYWNNMDLRESSVVEQTAAIDTHGLRAFGSGREVYLYVEKLNLPPAPPPAGNDNGNVDGERPQPETHHAPLDPKVARDYQRGALAEDSLDALLPTYRVHVLHDNGVKADDGARILVPAPSFGFYLYHQGPFLGWRDQISGAGAVRLSDSLYKLVVPNDTVAKVQVRVESVDADCADTCQGSMLCELACQFPYWWVLLFGLLLLFVIVVLLRRRT